MVLGTFILVFRLPVFFAWNNYANEIHGYRNFENVGSEFATGSKALAVANCACFKKNIVVFARSLDLSIVNLLGFR